MEQKQTIYEYLDYREYMKDKMQADKKLHPRRSMRWTAGRIGCDPAFLHRVLKGERNLSESQSLRLAEVFALPKQESTYWEWMVRYGRAQSHREKDHCMREMSRFHRGKIRQVPVQQYALYSHWYYVVLRELIHVCPPETDKRRWIDRLTAHLVPNVKRSEVAEAVEVLTGLGVVQKDAFGVFRLNENFVTTGESIPPVVVQRVLLEFLERAKEALELFPREERASSALTVSVSKNKAMQISERIREFRRDILALVEEEDPDLDRVYHLSMHFFPVSRPFGGKK